uniref:Uncharacterized protein n=1 Tax=Caenorhabditis japonica TaxID=281687 RepID=A0A8R1EN73_CAEJA
MSSLPTGHFFKKRNSFLHQPCPFSIVSSPRHRATHNKWTFSDALYSNMEGGMHVLKTVTLNVVDRNPDQPCEAKLSENVR